MNLTHERRPVNGDWLGQRMLELLLRDAGSREWEAQFGQLWDDAEAAAAEWRKTHGETHGCD